MGKLLGQEQGKRRGRLERSEPKRNRKNEAIKRLETEGQNRREVSMNRGKTERNLHADIWKDRIVGNVKKIGDRLLNFLFVGMCMMILAGCGNDVSVLKPDDIKVDMRESQEMGAITTPAAPTAEPTIESVESTTPADYYKAATNKTAQEVEDFARLVRETLLAKDFVKMSELVAYPITIDGERIESPEEFLNMDYASKLNPEFLKKVEEASCEQMFCNWQGIMLGEIGSVWIAEVLNGDLSSGELRVIALNDLVETVTSVTPEEVAETRVAYKQALLTILNELKLPDGTELYYDEFYEFSQNKFAIHDVDGDGREELILSYVTTVMAGQGKYVFGYDAEANTIYQQAVAFSMVFYDNGLIKADASHNHGRGEKLWPYTVYYYSPITDDYRYGVYVDSWEKAYYGETDQGAAFPAEADADGDGIVYYRMPYDDYSYSNPIDGAEYQEWYERQFGTAEIITPTYQEMTKENIVAIQ